MPAKTHTLFERFLWNFYIVDRNATTFEHVEEVPQYNQQMVPIFMILIISEEIIKRLKGKGTTMRLNDSLTSIALGIIREVTKLSTKGIQWIGYSWLYQYRFFDLDWKSPTTWWMAALGVDFSYYWLHRAAHEISLFWCGHQVHHSSEDYNLVTALRQSAFQHMFGVGYYQPLALLGIPLPAVLVHMQLNLYFQYWIHTEIISNLGPLEWIFNTASHHRVHHGVNKWCLDKNYAGFLIIWDKMFGTFEAERKDEKIIYGLVNQPQSFNPLYLQVFYFKGTFQKAFSMNSWGDFFRSLFYGPGWAPGTPRLGDDNAIPDKTPEREKYNPETPIWTQIYLLVHFALIIYAQQILMINYTTFNWMKALMFMFLIFYSLFTIGLTLDGVWFAPLLEAVRCIVTVALMRGQNLTGISPLMDSLIIMYFAASTLLWTSQSINILNSKKIKTV